MDVPTVGNRVRLGITNLLVEIERDHALPGDEALWASARRSDRHGQRAEVAPGGVADTMG